VHDPHPPSRPFRRISFLRLLLVAAGVGLIGYLTLRIGPEAIWTAFRSLSWGLLLVLVFPTGLAVVADTLAWRSTFLKPPRSFLRLLGIRLAGDAVNLATPTASVGGDLVKAYLLRPSVSLGDGLASVIADKTTSVVCQVLALLGGLLVAAILLPSASALLFAAGAALVVEILCAVGFVIAQIRGVIGGGGRLMAKFSMSPGPERQAVLDGMDHALKSLYVERGRRVMLSVLWHFVGFAVGTIEIYLVVRLLGVPISMPVAFAIGALGTAVKFFTFMVPASLGALEGGNVAIFTAFGLGGAVGLTYTLVRRLREIVWIAAGFLASHLVSLQSVPPGDQE
jgi:uncharacterized protein (TIRG00374 family)